MTAHERFQALTRQHSTTPELLKLAFCALGAFICPLASVLCVRMGWLPEERGWAIAFQMLLLGNGIMLAQVWWKMTTEYQEKDFKRWMEMERPGPSTVMELREDPKTNFVLRRLAEEHLELYSPHLLRS